MERRLVLRLKKSVLGMEKVRRRTRDDLRGLRTEVLCAFRTNVYKVTRGTVAEKEVISLKGGNKEGNVISKKCRYLAEIDFLIAVAEELAATVGRYGEDYQGLAATE
jgi:hypothetical protein